MKGKKSIIRFIGATQATIGALTITLSFVLHYNLFDILNWLNIAEKHISLCVLFLFVFSFVSIVSGFFLLREIVQH